MHSRRRVGVVGVGLAIGGILLAAIAVVADRSFRGFADGELQALLPEGFEARPATGSQLYHLGGCGDCHSGPPAGQFANAPVGGRPLETPAGTFYPPNLTPDVIAGIGAWSDVDFVNAMKFGVSPDGRRYFPAFPYTSFARSTVSDLMHLKAYLDGLNPVGVEPPDDRLRFPFNIRQGMIFWNLLFHDPAAFAADPAMSEEWNRGAYLVHSFGHCSACHTPRNLLFAQQRKSAFQGAPALKAGEPDAPRIAGIDRQKILNGLDEWSGSIDEKSAMYLVTLAYSQHASQDDLEAIAAYLSSLGGQ